MGLLENIERRRETRTAGTGLNLQFEIMDDGMIEQIVEFYRRLYMRGVEFTERNSGAYSKVWLNDRTNQISFYRQGHVGNEITKTNEEEYYYMLFYKSELWNVTCFRTVDEDGSSNVTKFAVVYLPDKLGKISANERIVTDIARQAINVMEDVAKNHAYKMQLEAVLAEDSIQDLIWMQKNWYEQIFESEKCRKFRDARQSANAENPSAEVKFELEPVNPIHYSEHFASAGQYVRGNCIIMPKVCVVNKDNQIRCIKIFREKNELYQNNPDIKFLPESPGAEYYLLIKGEKRILIETMEDRETKTIVILKLYIMSDFQMANDQLRVNILKAIMELAGIYYWLPKVDFSEALEIKVMNEDEILYIG